MHRKIKFLFFGLLTYTCLTEAFFRNLFSRTPPTLQEQLFTRGKQLVRIALKSPTQSIPLSLGVIATGTGVYKFRNQLSSRLNKIYSWYPAAWKTASTGAFLAATAAFLNKYGLDKSLYKKIKGHEFAAGASAGVFVAGLLGSVFAADYFKQLQETLQQNQKTMSRYAPFVQNIDTFSEVDKCLSTLTDYNPQGKRQEIERYSKERLNNLLAQDPELNKPLAELLEAHEQCTQLTTKKIVYPETELQRKEQMLNTKATEIKTADHIRRTLIGRLKTVQ